jgi:hypothetical protein
MGVGPDSAGYVIKTSWGDDNSLDKIDDAVEDAVTVATVPTSLSQLDALFFLSYSNEMTVSGIPTTKLVPDSQCSSSSAEEDVHPCHYCAIKCTLSYELV